MTWSWGGDGAGQTTRSIYFQYANKAEIGFTRPEGLVELNENRAEGLESGFFSETNISTLPIWAHLDDDEDDTDKPQNDLAVKVLDQIEKLKAIVLPYKDQDSGSVGGEPPGDGPLFGM